MEKGKAMTDHVHEWELGSNGLIVCWAGEKKVHVMEWDKVIRRLNATERLDKLIADLQDSNDGPNEMGGPFVALSVIAAALEGE